MTRNQIVIEDLVELINEHGGIESFSQAMSQLMDRAMAIERADALRAEPYQRTDTRRGYANGFKPKTLHARLGPVPLKAPQVRGDVSFYPSVLTKGPQAHQKRLRTSNWLENLNGKIKKRTSVVGLFPSVESLLRLVSAVLMETDERWLTGKRYLNMNTAVND